MTRNKGVRHELFGVDVFRVARIVGEWCVFVFWVCAIWTTEAPVHKIRDFVPSAENLAVSVGKPARGFGYYHFRPLYRDDLCRASSLG